MRYISVVPSAHMAVELSASSIITPGSGSDSDSEERIGTGDGVDMARGMGKGAGLVFAESNVLRVIFFGGTSFV